MTKPNFLIRFAGAVWVRAWVLIHLGFFLLCWARALLFGGHNWRRLQTFLHLVPTGIKGSRYTTLLKPTTKPRTKP